MTSRTILNAVIAMSAREVEPERHSTHVKVGNRYEYRLAREDYSSASEDSLEDGVGGSSHVERNRRVPDPNRADKKARSSYIYRQPAVRLYPDIRKHPSWKASVEVYRNKITRNVSMSTKKDYQAYQAKLMNTNQLWGIVEESSSSHRATRGGACPSCIQKGRDCLVQLREVNGRLEVTSRCMSCTTYEHRCDMSLGRSTDQALMLDNTVRLDASTSRASKGTLPEISSARRRQLLSVDIPKPAIRYLDDGQQGRTNKPTTALKDSGSTSSKRKRRDGTQRREYRQPKVRIHPNIRTHPSWKNAVELYKEKVSRNIGEECLSNYRSFERRLMQEEQVWGLVDETSDGEDAGGGPCINCLRRDSDCIVQLKQIDGQFRTRSACLDCCAHGRSCDIPLSRKRKLHNKESRKALPTSNIADVTDDEDEEIKSPEGGEDDGDWEMTPEIVLPVTPRRFRIPSETVSSSSSSHKFGRTGSSGKGGFSIAGAASLAANARWEKYRMAKQATGEGQRRTKPSGRHVVAATLQKDGHQQRAESSKSQGESRREVSGTGTSLQSDMSAKSTSKPHLTGKSSFGSRCSSDTLHEDPADRSIPTTLQKLDGTANQLDSAVQDILELIELMRKHLSSLSEMESDAIAVFEEAKTICGTLRCIVPVSSSVATIDRAQALTAVTEMREFLEMLQAVVSGGGKLDFGKRAMFRTAMRHVDMLDKAASDRVA